MQDPLYSVPSASLSPDPPATEPTPTESRPAPRSIMSRLDDGVAFVHNYDGSPQNVYRFIARCCGADTIRGDSAKGVPINLRYYFSHRVELIDHATGEAKDSIRIVLVDADDHYYSFVSGGIVQSLDVLISAMGDGPWEGLPPHKVIETKTRSGMKMLSLSVA